jgi:hypothetical protein
MPPEPRRVLLSDATSYKAAVIARYLKRRHARIEVLTCDARPASRLLHTRWSDRHFVVPSEADALLALVRDTGTDLFLPVNSRELDLLMPRKAEFGAALAYCGELGAYQALHRKDLLHARASSLGIPVPARFDSPEAIRTPAVAKPVAGAAAKGVRYLDTADDVDRFRRECEWSSFLVQEHVAGEGVGYSVFAKDGRVLAGYGHRRLAEFPTRGGSSVYREGWDDARARAAAERLIADTGWSGFAMFEWKCSAGDQLWLLEANPRVWGSIHQPLAAGVDLLAPLLGEAQPPLPREPDARTYFSPVFYGALLGYLSRGRPRPALEFVTSLSRNRADIPLHVDPLGWLGSLLRLA